MKDIKTFISNRIYDLRQAKQISARELSLSLGQNHSYINKVENGQSLPSYEILDYICEYFGISYSEFFDEGNKNPIDLEELLTEVRKLNRESLQLLVGIAKQINTK